MKYDETKAVTAAPSLLSKACNVNTEHSFARAIVTARARTVYNAVFN